MNHLHNTHKKNFPVRTTRPPPPSPARPTENGKQTTDNPTNPDRGANKVSAYTEASKKTKTPKNMKQKTATILIALLALITAWGGHIYAQPPTAHPDKGGSPAYDRCDYSPRSPKVGTDNRIPFQSVNADIRFRRQYKESGNVISSYLRGDHNPETRSGHLCDPGLVLLLRQCDKRSGFGQYGRSADAGMVTYSRIRNAACNIRHVDGWLDRLISEEHRQRHDPVAPMVPNPGSRNVIAFRKEVPHV